MVDSNAIALGDSPFPASVVGAGGSARVYTEYFFFADAPFSITPDPEYLFLAGTHRQAIEKIHYGIRSRLGFMLLTGEVGTGKTTLCRALLDQLQGQAQTVYIINPSLNGTELLGGVLDDLGLDHPRDATKKVLIDTLNRFLLANQTARPLVIIIDDAQTMPVETLEDLRLLSNLETDKHKLLQLLLVGQPELLARIDRPEMRQLRQRVAVHCSLDFLTGEEVRGYIDRRLFIAGNQGQVRFTSRAFKRIHRESRGVPRMINKICDLALTAAFVANAHVVDVRHVKAARGELIEGQAPAASQVRPSKRPTVLGLALVILLAMALGFALHPFVRARLGPQAEAGVRTTRASALPVALPPPVTPAAATASAPNSEFNPVSETEVGAYILQLGSYTSLSTTLRAIDIYAQQGLAAHWSALPCGENRHCFHVFLGRFVSRPQARQFQTAQGLTTALVRYAPWTVLAGATSTGTQAAMLQQRLRGQELDSYAVYDGNGRVRLCIGAFGSRAEAHTMALQIEQQIGVRTEVIDLSRLRPSPPTRASGTQAGNTP